MILSTTRQEADFYIARVGTKAGVPMWENYTSNNAFCVKSDDPKKDFQTALHLHRSGKLEPYIFGTCQGSIRKKDLERMLESHTVSDIILDKMIKIDAVIEAKKAELNKLYELQTAITKI